MKTLAITLALVVVTFFLSAWIGRTLSEKACYARWGSSGYEVKWTMSGGCSVKRPGKNWIPEKNICDMEN